MKDEFNIGDDLVLNILESDYKGLICRIIDINSDSFKLAVINPPDNSYLAIRYHIGYVFKSVKSNWKLLNKFSLIEEDGEYTD